MVITVLAIAFLIIIGFIAFLGYKTVISAKTNPEEINMEKCSICRQKIEKSQLIERQIGDYKLLYFCRECVMKLYADLGLKN